MKKLFFFVSLLVGLITSANAQKWSVHYSLGPAAYADLGDGITFSTGIEYRVSPAFSIAPTYTYASDLSAKGPSYYRWKYSEIVDASSNPPGSDSDYSGRDESNSFRVMMYFHPLALFSDKARRSDLALGAGFGFWSGNSLAYDLAPDPSHPRFEYAEYSHGWNFVPVIYYRYHTRKVFYGMRLGWENNSYYWDGPVAYVQFSVGFDIL